MHLVQLLLRPLEHPIARALLIPGCIVAGYIVNMAIVSQSGAVAVVGSIAVPLLLQKGISPATVGSLLLLGTSMGGELFNPAAVETVTLSDLTKICGCACAAFHAAERACLRNGAAGLLAACHNRRAQTPRIILIRQRRRTTSTPNT